MNDKMVFGQYYYGNSIIHKLDPKTKIVFTLLMMIAAFVVPTKGDLILYSYIILGVMGLIVLTLIILM